jgi:hypothetical protein
MKRFVLLILLLTCFLVVAIPKVRAQSEQPYYSISTISSVSVGQNFTVIIELNNVTTANVPSGIWGIEVHLTWDSTSIQPVEFTNDLGTTNGVLTGSIIYGIDAGFYNDSTGNYPSTSPYVGATFFNVAASSTNGAWWGTGNIATITFTNISSASTTYPLKFGFTDLVDGNTNSVAHGVVSEYPSVGIISLALPMGVSIIVALAITYKRKKSYKEKLE